MRWKNETQERPYGLEFVIAQEIIYDAYREGYIKWHTFQKAIEKVKANMNSGRMFEPNTQIAEHRAEQDKSYRKSILALKTS